MRLTGLSDFGIRQPPKRMPHGAHTVNETLRDALCDLAARDNAVRTELARTGELFGGYHPRMAAVHDDNARALAGIIAEWGWPGMSLVGEQGAEAAWLILQHAIGHPTLLRESLPRLSAAAEAGDVPAWQAAYLHDRICALEGRPQRYGTQFDWDSEGQLSPLALEDAEQVDVLREAVGLGPIDERISEARANAEREGEQAPDDIAEWQKKKADWARSVGWR